MTPTTTPEENIVTRTITTAAELDALPWGAVVARTIFGAPGEDWHKRRDGMWLGTDGDAWAADLLAATSDHAHIALTLVTPAAQPVVSDAAVEAGARALHADSCAEDPDDGEPCSCGPYEREARVVLTAALPHLTAQPAPEASREDVAMALHGDECPEDPDEGDVCNCDAEHYLHQADALLARFVITERGER